MFDNEKDKQNARQFTKQWITFKVVNLKNNYHPLIKEWECIIKAAGITSTSIVCYTIKNGAYEI